jgi:hypothetical protein
LPPKLLSLSAARDAEPVAWEAHTGGWHVEHAVQCIEGATFTGKGDQPIVVQLYKNYVDRIVATLSKTLAHVQREEVSIALQPDVQMLPVPPAVRLQLAEGQFVQLVPEPSCRRDGSDGGQVLAVVGVGGRVAEDALGDGRLGLSLERCGQAVLPWRRRTVGGWAEGLQRDVSVLRAVGTLMQQLEMAAGAQNSVAVAATQLEAEATVGATVQATEEAAAARVKQAVAAMQAHLKMASESVAITRLAEAIRNVPPRMEELKTAIGTRQLEVAAAAAYAETGARGKRRYAVGQLLSVRLATSEWVDVEVACDEDVVQPPSEEDEGQLVGEHAAKADSLQAVEEAGRKEVERGEGGVEAGTDEHTATSAAMADVEEPAAPVVAGGEVHSLRVGPLHEGWVLMTHGAVRNGHRYALLWSDRAELQTEDDGRPPLVVPLGATASSSLTAGGSRLTIRNELQEVRLTAAAAGKMATWYAALKRATSGEPDQQLALRLHPWNHAPRELPRQAFEEMREWHFETLRAQHSLIRDALSGRSLDVLRQCVAIEVEKHVASGDAGEGGLERDVADIKDAFGLAGALQDLYMARYDGNDTTSVAAVLLTAGPAAGKTSLLSQVVVHLLAATVELVPIIVKIQQLQLRLLEGGDTFADAWNWIDAYRTSLRTLAPLP